MEAIKEVFRKLSLSKGHKFSSMFPTPETLHEATRLWAMEIIFHKLTPKMLAIGTHKAINKPGFCPDLAEFIALCRPSPEDFGLPALQVAYEEACYNAHPSLQERNWSHSAVFHTAQAVGYYELRSLPKDTTLPMFEAAYQRTVESVLNGEELPEIPKALEDLSNKPKPPGWKPSEEDRAKGRECLSNLKAMFSRGGAA